MYYANCNLSKPFYNYDVTTPCWQNVYSRSPSLVSQECPAYCFGSFYNYTNYLTNSFVGYFYFSYGCHYPLNSNNSISYNYNLTSVFPEIKLPITVGYKNLVCNTSNCNSQAFGACITAELIQSLYSYNSTENGGLIGYPVYQSCSSDISSLPIFKLTITLCLKVNQVFISDYNNLNSAASLSFIQNFTKFVNYQLLIVYFINFYYFLIQKDEYCFKK